MARDVSRPLGHVVHIERLEGHGVKLWLDGMRVKSLRGWSLVEETRPPSVLTLTINTDQIVWGAPDGIHWCDVSTKGRRTPSGKYACETCGESWPCSAMPPGPIDGGQAWRAPAAAALEAPGSLLCDCGDRDGAPIGKVKLEIDHHCDCAAVAAAAQVLGDGTKTRHADDCYCGGRMLTVDRVSDAPLG